MEKKVILHICQLEKFIPPYIDLIRSNFNVDKHVFILAGDKNKFPYKDSVDVFYLKGKIKKLIVLTKLINQADKIILHGLFMRGVVYLLYFQPWVLKKCYWVIWGGDLYTFNSKNRSLSWNFLEYFRKRVIKNIGHLVTGTTGDVDLCCKWYGAKGKHHKCFNYPSNLFKPHQVPKKISRTITILVGNSADPTNNHLEVFEKLEKFKEQDIKIIVPLSYGNNEYADKVINYGYRVFGKKFSPMLNFIPYDEYIYLLGSVDIAIFNHKRQQAFGNIISLLGFGKKVYINSESTLVGVFQEYDLKVLNVDKIDLRPLDKEISEKNINQVKENFTEEVLIKSLEEVFNW